jgi:plasmid stabilization system protein ParE
MKRLVIRRRAEHHMAEAALWYERKRHNLALRFIRAAEDTFKLFQANPGLGHVVYEQFRKMPVRGFPFGAFYSITRGAVIIQAVLHSSRSPEVIREILEGTEE